MTARWPDCPLLPDPDGRARGWPRRCHQGHQRCVRAAKRFEAERRNAVAVPRRQNNLKALQDDLAMAGECVFPWKRCYPTGKAANAGIRAMKARWDKGSTERLAAYECVSGGHFHIGHERPLGRDARRASVAWKK